MPCLDWIGIFVLDFSLILKLFLFWKLEGSSLGGWNVSTLKLFFFLEGLSSHPNFKPFTMFGRFSWVELRFFSVKGMVSPSVTSSKLPSCFVCCTTLVCKILVFTIGIDLKGLLERKGFNHHLWCQGFNSSNAFNFCSSV